MTLAKGGSILDFDYCPNWVIFACRFTQVVRGKIMFASQEKQPIPEGWDLDVAGRPTTPIPRRPP